MIIHIEDLDIQVEYDYTAFKYAEIINRLPTECDTEENLKIHNVIVDGETIDFLKGQFDNDYIYDKTLEQIYKNRKKNMKK